jgi:hypothetical protein
MHRGIIRVHHDGGEVHFRNDAAQLEAAVPVEHFVQRFQYYMERPDGDLVFRDWTRAAVVTLTYKHETHGRVTEASLDLRLEKIENGPSQQFPTAAVRR